MKNFTQGTVNLWNYYICSGKLLGIHYYWIWKMAHSFLDISNFCLFSNGCWAKKKKNIVLFFFLRALDGGGRTEIWVTSPKQIIKLFLLRTKRKAWEYNATIRKKENPIEFYTYFSLYFLTKTMMKKGNKCTILLQVSNRRMRKRKGWEGRWELCTFHFS